MKALHSQESVDRAAITLRDITAEIGGRGISAVLLLEEQLTLQRELIQELLRTVNQVGITAHYAETRAKQLGA